MTFRWPTERFANTDSCDPLILFNNCHLGSVNKNSYININILFNDDTNLYILTSALHGSLFMRP